MPRIKNLISCQRRGDKMVMPVWKGMAISGFEIDVLKLLNNAYWDPSGFKRFVHSVK